ncbi:LuxR C-terminal-related transcriptional regulator [Funiculus sociatus]|jgi:hypothetical protein|uniref:LuxR C-terminal-related transcriptional regulator n=1 Tax=Funiculus sociatus TaxID=450527 RepID=UPI0018EF89C4
MIRESTVKLHMNNVLKKLKVKTRYQALAHLLQKNTLAARAKVQTASKINCSRITAFTPHFGGHS